ncbi:lipopolysaccharide biosynthesis protein [Altererythrobacter sp. MTPC7]|uniref:lipopolysaccharide biosynthesis protein n=1 Tax=Altererythrobacter sp. MTPC7 TaxID=3056567 RepID=UPI0036F3C1B6
MSAAKPFSGDLFATALVTGSRMGGAALSFALATLLSAMLGAGDAGIFYASLSWGTALAIIALWGAPQLVLHEVPPLLGARNGLPVGHVLLRLLIGNIRTFAVLALVLALFASIFSSAALRSTLALDIRFALATGLLLIVLRSASEGAKALGYPLAATLVEFVLVPGLALAALTILGWAAEARFPGIATIYTGAMLLAACAGSAYLLKRLRPHDRGVAAGPLPQQWSARRRTFAQIEIGQFLSSVGAIAFVPLVLGNADVGVLNLVLRIAALVSIVTAALPSVYLPRLARAQAGGDIAKFSRTLASLRMVMGLSGIAAFLAIVLAGPFILRFAGPEFLAGAPALPWAAAGFCAALALGPAGMQLTLLGRERALRNIVLPIGVAGIGATLLAGWLGGPVATAAMPGAAALAAKIVQLVVLRQAHSGQGERFP